MPDNAADDLWHFAVSLYGTEGSADLCLQLQETFDADVPVLLYVLWLARKGHRIDAPAMQRIESEVGDWRNSIVLALRTVRRLMKTGPSPAPTRETDVLRNAVKAAELSAEKIELAHLAGLMWSGKTLSPTKTLFQNNLTTAITHYAKGETFDAHVGAALVSSALDMQHI